MCDFGRGDYTQEELIIGLDRVLTRLGRAPLVHLAIPGSFLDEHEVPPDLRGRVLKALSARGVVALGIEARPEHIRTESLMSVVRRMKEAGRPGLLELSVGTGVETFDDAVASICINKDSSRAAASRSLDAVRCADSELEDVSVVAEAHVLLKPPVLTEAEAIDDATAAIEWCLNEGFERAILMVCSAKPRTPLRAAEAAAGRRGEGADYRPPSLWSALEVLARLSDSMRSRVRIHGFASNTQLGLRPTSCPACEQVVTAAIQHFNSTGSDDWITAVRRLGCECREGWTMTCAEAPGESLWARMGHFVDALERVPEAEGAYP
jgi:radical SAM enzyme (TIGR01210 family)